MESNPKGNPFLPGAVGPYEDPRQSITVEQVRPYLVAILLHHGAFSLEDAVSSISPHCPQSDLKISLEQDGVELTNLEKNIIDAIGSMVECGLLAFDPTEQKWSLVIGERSKNLSLILNWVSSMGACLPLSLNF